MLKTLLHKQLLEIYRSYFYDAKKNKARSRASTAAYIALFVLLMAGVLGGMFTALSITLCGPLSAAGMDFMYFALLGLLAVLLGTFGSVFNTYSALYLAKDNDLLLSMPIPVRTIMVSRLLSVYLMGLMYSSVVIVPAVVVYWCTVSAAANVVLGSVLLVALISIFVLTLSCALGWVVAKISLRLKNKSLITVLISLVCIAVYYFFCFKAQTLVSDLLLNAVVYGQAMKDAAYPVYLFGMVAVGDGKAMAVVAAAVLALFALLWLLLSRSFLKIATASGATQRRVYRRGTAKQGTIASALLSKELRRFIASPTYMLNCGLGIVLLPLAGVMLLLHGQSLLTTLEQELGFSPDATALLLCGVVCLIASMNDIIAPSVSLEGKSLWLLQSLPVTPWQVMRAKLSVQWLLTGVPMLLCFVCVLFAHSFTVPQALLLLATLALYELFLSLLGLMIGLKMPNLSWTSEITPIKQSGSVALALFGGFLYAILPVAGYLLANNAVSALACMGLYALLTLLLCALLYAWLRKKGSRIFAAL